MIRWSSSIEHAMRLRLLVLFLLSCGLLLGPFAQADSDPAVTVADPNVPLVQLDVMLMPMTATQLRVEASAWQGELQKTAQAFADLELRMLQREQEESTPERQAANEADLARLIELAREREGRIKRLTRVLDQITRKEGLDKERKEPPDVASMRRYIASVNGMRSDVIDTRTLLSATTAWFTDREGGMRVGKVLLTLLLFMAGFWFLGYMLARAINKALVLSGRSSRMLTRFNQRNLPRFLLLLGILSGLAYLDINITPLVAMIGGASFIVAFALQDTLSNFASGLMIMLYKPFDMGDFVNVAGIQGTVQSMTLVSTTISTIDNKVIMVPNNSIWGDVITNFTGVKQRRVDLVFGIGYRDDMAKAERILRELAVAHPKTLAEPEPVIKLHELAESSVNFICRPWVRTEDYWEVHWDLTRQVKERFDAEGVSIPFPQRDVHVIEQGDKA